MRLVLINVFVWLLSASVASAGEVSFSAKPSATKDGDKVKIAFTLSAPTDVEVAVLGADGKVVRHLAAGVLGAKNPPPEPLKAGLAQELAWDGLDDFGKAAAGGPFKFRVRAGTGVKFGQHIGQNPGAALLGAVSQLAADGQGTVYVSTSAFGAGYFRQIVALDSEGRYLRTVLPFPANLEPARISEWAWHDGQAFHPINRECMGPDFCSWNSAALLPVADDKGPLFCDGQKLYRLAPDGGTVGGKLQQMSFWPPKKAPPNLARIPPRVAFSPDGKHVYLAGPYSCETGPYHADPSSPPGQIWRMEVGRDESMQPFARIEPAAGKIDENTWPVRDIAVDKDGYVLAADGTNQCIQVLDAAGKPAGKLAVAGEDPPHLMRLGADGQIYVLTYKSIYPKTRVKLQKYSGWKDGKLLAELSLGEKGVRPDFVSMAVSARNGKARLWLCGIVSVAGVSVVDDDGAKLAQAPGLGGEGERSGSMLMTVDRIVVDPRTDQLFVNDSIKTFREFNGLTGEGGGALKLDGQGVVDMAIGPDGHRYAQLGAGAQFSADNGYSGPLRRYDANFKPAPYPGTGSNLLSGYIYGRMHPAGVFCEKGIGVSRDGKVYVNSMFGGWVRYAVGAYGPDGKGLNGKASRIDANHYYEDQPSESGKVHPHTDKCKPGQPKELTNAVVGPLPQKGGGVRVDSRGRIYVGLGVRPAGWAPPAGFEKDVAYKNMTGSIVRFGPEGGSWGSTGGTAVVEVGEKDRFFFKPGPKPEGAMALANGDYLQGADKVYADYGQMSGPDSGAGGMGRISSASGWCVCRSPRFDLDLYDRLYIPNTIANSVRICDNSGNEICSFGAYGNFDSLYVPPDSKDKKPLVAMPEIPLGWPVGAAASERAVYVSDMLNRRVVRADLVWKAEELCDIK
jgi:hypothetical protein